MRVLMLLLGCFSAAIHAAEDELRFDWREECRLALSGAYLAQRSEAEMLAQNEVALKERITALEKALKATRREEDLLKKETSKADFDPALAEREVGVKDRAKLLATQVEENRRFLKDTQEKHLTLAKQVAALEARMKKVFKIEKSKMERREPVLSYLAPCPRFHNVCPLPEVQRTALLKISEGKKTPLACERYAQIR